MSLDLSQAATDLLDDLASSTHIKLVRRTSEVFDPVTSKRYGGSDAEFPLTGSVGDIPDHLLGSNTSSGTGNRIVASDRMMVVDNQLKPLMTDKIRLGSDEKKFIIIDIKPKNHAGIVQVYRIICRG